MSESAPRPHGSGADAPGDGSDPSSSTLPLSVSLHGVGRRFQRARTSVLRAAGFVDALVDVTLDIPAGSRFGIVGESGSGKTTLMRLIAALDRPTSGRIEVAGTDITDLREPQLRFLRHQLQIVFQDPMGSLDPRMRIGRIVAEPLQVQRHPDVPGAVRRALEQVGIDPSAAGRYPHQFSGGQRQRISIARAIAPEPSILIADEAVSALDVTVRSQILDLVEDLVRRRNLTLIFVSHDLSVIRRVCDRVAVLQSGRVVETGLVEQVYSEPESPYTRELLAAVPTLDRSLALARARREIAGSLEDLPSGPLGQTG
jgi:ABC-type glutathione transport system ATPase component